MGRCLPLEKGRRFLPVFDICSTDCVVARVASPALHLVSGTEAKQYIISQLSDGGRERERESESGGSGKRREMAFSQWAGGRGGG